MRFALVTWQKILHVVGEHNINMTEAKAAAANETDNEETCLSYERCESTLD